MTGWMEAGWAVNEGRRMKSSGDQNGQLRQTQYYLPTAQFPDPGKTRSLHLPVSLVITLEAMWLINGQYNMGRVMFPTQAWPIKTFKILHLALSPTAILEGTWYSYRWRGYIQLLVDFVWQQEVFCYCYCCCYHSIEQYSAFKIFGSHKSPCSDAVGLGCGLRVYISNKH